MTSYIIEYTLSIDINKYRREQMDKEYHDECIRQGLCYDVYESPKYKDIRKPPREVLERGITDFREYLPDEISKDWEIIRFVKQNTIQGAFETYYLLHIYGIKKK